MNRGAREFLLTIAIIFSLIPGCSEFDDTIPLNEDTRYYPLQEGDFRIFQVDEILYTIGNDPDTNSYFLREEVGQLVDSSDSEVRYLVNFFRKEELLDTIPWQLTSTIAVNKSMIRVLETASNKPVIKLVYPVQENLRWDANAANTDPEDQFEMRQVNEEFDNQILTFANSVSIYQAENLDTLISRDFRKEVYAFDVGLVERQIETLDFCQDSECFGQGIVEEGRIYKQTIVDFGIQ